MWLLRSYICFFIRLSSRAACPIHTELFTGRSYLITPRKPLTSTLLLLSDQTVSSFLPRLYPCFHYSAPAVCYPGVKGPQSATIACIYLYMIVERLNTDTRPRGVSEYGRGQVSAPSTDARRYQYQPAPPPTRARRQAHSYSSVSDRSHTTRRKSTRSTRKQLSSQRSRIFHLASTWTRVARHDLDNETAWFGLGNSRVREGRSQKENTDELSLRDGRFSHRLPCTWNCVPIRKKHGLLGCGRGVRAAFYEVMSCGRR